MKKSVYSIVLMDDVIKAVDEKAYRLGTSRSNLINQILAEHLSCITPEMRMKDIFDSAENLINNSLLIQQRNSPTFMTVKTGIQYRYRPTISYRIELDRSPDIFFGTVKVGIRTQNTKLSFLFKSFFQYFAKFEKNILSEKGCNDYCYSLDLTTFARKLIYSKNMTDQQLGEAVGMYIKHLDRCIKFFFSSPETFSELSGEIEREYRQMLKKYII